MEKWQIYVREAVRQLEFARSSFEAFEQASVGGNTAQVFSSVHHFLVHLANVGKLLRPKNAPVRVALLAGHVDLSAFDFKPLTDLRNDLEHFDTRLDKWVADHHGETFFDMNIVTGAKGFPKKAYLRALDGDTFKFYGKDYPLRPLLELTNSLHGHLLAGLKAKGE